MRKKRKLPLQEQPTMINTEELITFADAARLTGKHIQTIITTANTGKLTVYIDLDAPTRQGRRKLLLSDVTRRWKLTHKEGTNHVPAATTNADGRSTATRKRNPTRQPEGTKETDP